MGALGGLASCAPKQKQRHIDLFTIVRCVHLKIARRCRSIVAARTGNRLQRIAADILVDRRVCEKTEASAAADCHAALEEIFGGHGADQPLWKWFRLSHETPVPRSDHPILRDVRPNMIVGYHVHDARFENALWLIEAQPVRGAPTAIVTGNHKALISELFHDLNEIACHLAEAEIDVIWARLGK